MRILCIGDPHGDIDKIKKIDAGNVDLIFVVGDLGKADKAREFAFENVRRRNEGLEEVEYTKEVYTDVHMEIYNSSMDIVKYLSTVAPTYLILGNVGGNDEDTLEKCEQFGIELPLLVRDIRKLENVHLLRDKKIEMDGIKIGGLEYFIDTNWVEDFAPNDEERMEKAIEQTKNAKQVLDKLATLDLLMCHQPPYGILDKVTFKGAPKHWQGKHAGSKTILEYVKKYQPKYVICGHIHEGYGETEIGETKVYNLGVAEHKIIEL